MRFEGTIVREQGIVFAIVVVKRHILDNNAEATGWRAASSRPSLACPWC